MTIAISAHRGGAESEDAIPDWTVYRGSIGIGVEYVEFDIRRTRDGEFVVYHDARVPALDGRHSARQPIAELSYGELCLRAGYEVPRVREVMKIVAGCAKGHLDLKEIGIERPVIEMAIDILGPGNFIATTLEDESIRRIKNDFPDVLTALSLGRDAKEISWLRRLPTRLQELYPIRRIRRCGADWVAVNWKLAQLSVLGECRRNGISTMVWTVPPSRFDQFLTDPRVNVLITNFPRAAVERRSKLARLT